MRSRKKSHHQFLQPTVLIPLGALALLILIALASQTSLFKKSESSKKNSSQYLYEAGGPLPLPSSNRDISQGASGSLGSQDSLNKKPFGDSQNGFYGKIKSISNTAVMVNELLIDDSQKLNQGKTYEIAFANETIYVYQQKNISTNRNAALFTPREGKRIDLKPGMYTFVSSYENPSDTTSLTAAEIIYSDVNPFVK